MKAYSFNRQDSGSGNFPPPPPPPPNNPQYGFTPPPPPGNQGGSASSNAIISLVLGILSYIMCPVILGIAAWIMGNNELKAIDSGQSSEAGRTLANIGKWLGIVNIILTVIGIILIVILMSLGLLGSMFNN
ncbi:MAG: DUF4190 domain-containing protein [Ignavibacteria bacterium]|nr:DUF4190 domain-containing protein [Ignavibacteria bacterium]MBK6773867.1 DUF4190 domain-containing protein [Ignavibacteria bacterium]MBK7160526.1 DUF4190 domain-containing protein [Ignavibacteria bacterium]